MNKTSIAPLVLPLLLLSACVEVEDEPPTAEWGNELWSTDTAVGQDEWSGNSSGTYIYIGCAHYDDDSDGLTTPWLLAGVHAFREARSLDNFVARLDVRCAEYDENPIYRRLEQTGTVEYDTLYSAGIGADDGQSWVGSTRLPIGIRLETNAGNDYVKDLAMLQGRSERNAGGGYISGYGAPSPSGWALNYTNHRYTEDLMCPDQMVVQGLYVRHDPGTGKMGWVRIYCTALSDI